MMMNMEVDNTDDQLVTIHFDDNVNEQFNKLFLMKHSAYFEVMFNGNFLESQSEQKIHIKEISHRGFVKVILSLKCKEVIYNNLEELLIILEVSQILQFPFIIAESIKIIEEQYLLTFYAVNIFPMISRLGIKNLLEKCQAYILYNFKSILVMNGSDFYKLSKVDLQTLLNNNSLIIDKEEDVFDLIVTWCSVNGTFDFEYEMIVSCVRFKSMNNEQLKYCISKTNNIDLQNIMTSYMHCTREKQDIMESFIRPIRNIPFGLCTVKNELDGYSYVYRWDWASMQFKKFIRLDPLPRYKTEYNLCVKELDVYIMFSRNKGISRSSDKEGWKYNLLSEKWKPLNKFNPLGRRYKPERSVNNNLYLIESFANYRLPNDIIELFEIDPHHDTLVKIHNRTLLYLPHNGSRKYFICLEYKGSLALITKDDQPTWYYQSLAEVDEGVIGWNLCSINLREKVICATCYNDTVYMLTYNKKRTINLYSYCPVFELSKKLKSFNILYKPGATMCAFNFDKVMVFRNDTFEYYSVDNNFFIEYKIQLDSFYSKYFFSVPIYIEKTL